MGQDSQRGAGPVKGESNSSSGAGPVKGGVKLVKWGRSGQRRFKLVKWGPQVRASGTGGFYVGAVHWPLALRAPAIAHQCTVG